ncbi:hypothetical protein Tco_0807514 [Tanacetum coccineum]
MQLLYCFINNIHVDYAELLWEGLYNSLLHLTGLIPYPRFTKIIVEHYMIENPNISRRLHDHYHKVENDEVVKSIFNSRKNKEGYGMKIPEWKLTDEMKLIAQYHMYAIIFQVDVLTTQSQPIESTQGTHRTPSALGHLTLSLLMEKQNVEKVQEHLVDEKIDQLLEGNENVDTDVLMDEVLNSQEDPGTRIEPRSDKESPEMKKSDDVLIIHDDKEEEELAIDTLIRRKGKGIKEIRNLRQSFILRRGLPSMVDKRINEIVKKIVPLYVAKGLLLDRKKSQDTKIKFEKPATVATPFLLAVVHAKDHEDHHDDDAHPERESNAKRQKTYGHQMYLVGESSSEQVMDQEPNRLGSGTQEQLDELDAWMDDFEADDDEVPTEEVSPELLEEISGEIDEAQLLISTNSKEASCQRDPKASPITLLNQDLFYLNHGNSGPKKYIISLHMYLAVPFPENDIKELTIRWIVEVIRTSYELGHEHKFITEIMVRRDNGKINPITESDYKHLNKNDIKYLYLLYVNDKVKDYRETGLLGSLSVFIRSYVIGERVRDFQLGMESYQQKVNLTTPTITFTSIEKKKLLTITSKPVVGLIYENNKKEKRVMILKEIPKFCDAILKRVLKMVKKYNKN